MATKIFRVSIDVWWATAGCWVDLAVPFALQYVLIKNVTTFVLTPFSLWLNQFLCIDDQITITLFIVLKTFSWLICCGRIVKYWFS